MMKFKFTLLFFACVLFTLNTVAQCVVKATASSTVIFCGNEVKLAATHVPGSYVFETDFNTGAGVGWGTTPNAVYTNPCGAPFDGSPYLWFDNSSANPRTAVSAAYDLSTGGSICFVMRFAKQDDGSPCEGPDLEDEGVFLDYSLDGTNWANIEYYSPNGGFDPERINWKEYCVIIPDSAKTASTKIRWHQPNASPPTVPGSTDFAFDHWGLENILVTTNDPNFIYKWEHTGIVKGDGSTPIVKPIATTTYNVAYYDTSGLTNDSCNASVTITTSLPVVTALALDPIVCPEEDARLIAISSLINPVPTDCGLENYQGCVPGRSNATEVTLGNGNTIPAYNGGEENPYGDFGTATYTAQFLYHADQLNAQGMSAGRITSLSFDVPSIQANGNTSSTSKNLPNFRIAISCTNKTTMNAFESGMMEVYSPRTQKVATGRNDYFFENAFRWDGKTNIVVEICWYYPDGESSSYNQSEYPATRGYNPGYQSSRASTTNFSDGFCDKSNQIAADSYLPNTIFGFCIPKNPELEYTWTPSEAFSDNDSSYAVATLGHNTTTYTVTVGEVGGVPGCEVSADVEVLVQKPQISFIPTDPEICSGDSIEIIANIDAIGVAISPVLFSKTVNATIPDPPLIGTPPGLTSTINVAGISPVALNAGSIVKVCMNIDHDRLSELQVSLTSPSGTVINLVDRIGGEGDDYINTCFTLTGAALPPNGAPYTGEWSPANPFTNFAGNNANGNWVLRVRDYVGGYLVTPVPPVFDTVSGDLLNWSIDINGSQPNFITYFEWQNAATLNRNDSVVVKSGTSDTTTYTVYATDQAGCETTEEVTVKVTPPSVPEITIAESVNNFCEGDETVIFTATPVNGGARPSYQWYKNGGPVGLDQSTYTPSTLEDGDVITAKLTSSEACAAPLEVTSTGITMVINDFDDANFTYATATFCSNDANTISPSGPVTAGGVWTINPVPTAGFNSTTGAFTPNLMGDDSYDIKYVTSNACPDSNEVTVSVVTDVNAAFTYPKTSYCVSEDNTFANFTTGTAGTFSANDGGLFFENTSNGEINIKKSTPGTYEVYNIITGGGDCGEAKDTFDIIINALPDALFNVLGTDYCTKNGIEVALTPALAGGTFSGNGVYVDTFKVDSVALGSHTIRYDITDVKGCIDSSFQSTKVNPLPNAAFQGLDAQYCIDASSATLAGTVSGGTFKGPGIASNLFSPAAAGVGTHTITYTRANAFGCVDSTSQQVTINGLPDASFTGLILDNCVYDVSYGLVPALNGGVFSGKGITDSIFDPAIVGSGNYTITYNITDVNGCKSNSSQPVNIYERPVVTTDGDTSLCVGESASLFVSALNSTYRWSPGVTLNDSISATPLATPTATTTYTVSVTDEFCINSGSVEVIVNEIPVADAGADASKCPQDIIQLTAENVLGADFLWSPADGLSNPNIFNPMCNVPTNTTYTLTVTKNGCVATSELTITNDPLPIASFTFNKDSLNVDFVGNTADGITFWKWDFGDRTNPSFQKSPSHAFAQIGTFIITLIVRNPCGADTVVFEIDVTGGIGSGGTGGDSTTSVQPTQVLNASVNLYPNPFNDGITLDVEAKKQLNFTYEIINLLGQTTFLSQETIIKSGLNSLKLDNSQFGEGQVFFVKLNLEDEIAIYKVIKQ
ncbi:MAG: PKD repeat protein/subtilisin-like proprotein convertase family protein [Sphingobacteriales bacterium]|jgi:PKD repeat protein/subtilisin-like proprotein convertase family protein